MSTAIEPVHDLIEDAFRATCEAVKLIYASGASSETKDHIIAAHSHLLALRHIFPVKS